MKSTNNRGLRQFPQSFWVANTMELFERWAWYGMFMLFGLYLTKSTDTGALGFSQTEKGMIMGPIVGLLYFLPVITGALADRFGYKKILIIAYSILTTGYLLLGVALTFWSVFFAFLYLAIGAALFKPVISATIAKTTTEKNSSIGFGIFYMMVNIGAFIGPFVASVARENNWSFVFIISSIAISLNFFLLIFFFKEPKRKIDNRSLIESLKEVFRNIGLALKDMKFLVFLVLITGFWSMYNQLFYSLPVFIDQWFDTHELYKFINQLWPWLAEQVGTKEGIIKAEMITNIDALYIIMFQLLVSSLVMKLKPINAMISGIFVSAIGIGLTFLTNNPFFIFLAILIFGLGEMASSPKITEYIGRISPKDKTALYMGCSFIPMFGGNIIAGYLSGDVYTKFADKVAIVKTEMLSRQIKMPVVNEHFSFNDYFHLAADKLNMSEVELTQHLWEKYNPSNIWLIFTGIGIGTAILLFVYNVFWIQKNNK
ncbi:MAG: MFS transporter [Marinilabiliales bacterium]|nr:MAG: MFS transporter [Marinilabiliales bacterium]